VHRIAFLLVLAGCTQSADDAQPACDSYALQLLPPGNAAIAVGGEASYAAVIVDSCDGLGPHWTFGAKSSAPSIIAARIEDSLVVLHASAPGTALVTVTSADQLSATVQPVAVVLDHVQLASPEDGVPDAFLVGAPVADVDLFAADGRPLIDTSMTITGAPPTTSANEVAINGLAVGDHPLAITAGGQSWSATVHVVGTIDAVVARAASVTLQVGQTGHVCFDAKLAGQVVAGASWQLAVPSANTAGGRPNCADVQASAPTSFTVTATALGMSAATTVTFTP
jgi:hypothetical protein